MSILQQQISEQKNSSNKIVIIQFPAQIESSDHIQKSIIQCLTAQNQIIVQNQVTTEIQSDKCIKKLTKYDLLLHCKDQPKALDFLTIVAINKSLDINFQIFCQRLNKLNLNVNNITSIQKLAYLPLHNLTQIHLSMNKINTLKVFSKLNCRNLVYLNVCQNRVKSINQIFRSDLCNLQMFWTYDNILESHQQIFKMNSKKLNGFEISPLQNVGYFVFPLYKKFANIGQSFEDQEIQNDNIDADGYQQCDFYQQNNI